MCGIAGLVGNTHDRKHIVHEMLDRIAHRGPDERRVWSGAGVILGHVRLSIVDLEHGQQPMEDAFGRYTIVFNGEIYGYPELKRRYGNYPYKTNSDTELILAMLHEEGPGFIHNLPGMFAFAVWDAHTHTLFCARDRFGEKPFYYFFDPQTNTFGFASEAKAITKTGLIHCALDRESLSHYFKRLYVPVNKSIYKHLNVLPPAHCLHFRSGKLEISRYWELPSVNTQIQYGEAKEHLRFLLKKAVREQLVADVPVGAFLSGGVDSSCVVGYASKASGSALQTFSFGFEGERNELGDAKTHAGLFGTRHREFIEADYHLPDLFLKMQDIYDEPFADSSNIPMYLISKSASEGLKVVLTGDGGDELLGGYSYWYGILLDTKADMDTQRPLLRLLRYLPLHRWALLPNRIRTKLLALLEQSALLKKGAFFAENHKKQNIFYRDDMISQLGLPAAYGDIEYFSYLDSVEDAMRLDIQNYMPGDILVKTDRASMANSLELRSPFLNVDLASFCLSLPWQFKIRDGITKFILKDILKEDFPGIHLQKHKLGFGAPVGQWLAKPGMQALKNDLLFDKNNAIYDYVDFQRLAGFTQRNNTKTWAAMNFSAWLAANPHS
ncbi:MAG: asparagine synthase (glutamine-hydrolyzing) [Saprospiraceae bacterium]